LLFLTLYRNEAHRRTLCRFADSFRVCSIILLPFDKGLHVLWRNQADFVAQVADLTRPIMRTATRFHCDNTRRLPGEKLKEPVPAKLFAQNNRARCISPVRLKNCLRQIKTNCVNFHCGRLLFSWRFKSPPQWHMDAAEGRPLGRPHGVIAGASRPEINHWLGGWLFPDKMEVRAHDWTPGPGI
jgi:hypothetical protein